MIVDPAGFTFQGWTDAVIRSSNFGEPLPKVLDESQWQDWAAVVTGLPGVVSQQPPSPYLYDSWQSWAADFNQAVRY